jgi:sporulation protein YlmC with PRC-barrel domain
MHRSTTSRTEPNTAGHQARLHGTVSTRQIIDQPVYDVEGKPFGRVSEIVFETQRGMAAYVIIKCKDERKCALPYEMLHINRGASRLQARIHRDVFLGDRRVPNT